MRVQTHYFPTPELDPAQLATELDSPSTLVLVFSGLAAADVADAVQAVRHAFPQSAITGCSTAGEVIGCTVRDGGISVAVARFERTPLSVVRADVPNAAASYAGGIELARHLQDPDLSGVLVYSDGLNVNGSQLLQGLNHGLADGVMVTGGLAGDADRFAATWVIADDRPMEGAVVAIGLHGDAVMMGHGSQSGWDSFGPPRVVTRSEGNVVHELDGQPILDLYERYLGDLAPGLPGIGLFFPLAISDGPDGERLIRAMLAVDHEARTLTFAGDVPEGWTAQLMRADFDRLVDGAARAADETAAISHVVGDCLAVAVSCVARRLVLKERIEEELEAALDRLPTGAQLVGFYSYGEISPLASGRCDLHNQTMTLTTLAERPT
jgi:hypothetical protein